VTEIRFLKSEDAAEWRRLRIEALQNDPEAFSASLEEYQALSMDEIKRRLWSDGDSFVAGAFEDGQMTGMAGFFREKGPKSRHKGRVWGVYVTHASRGRGIGRRLMRTLLDRGAAIEGVEQILLSVTVSQEAASCLYRSLGFEPFGREPRALKIKDHYIDEIYMVLPAKSSAGVENQAK